MGVDPPGDNVVQVYWIMGRSDNSRKRVFSFDEYDRLYTEPTDPSNAGDLRLIIYNAMRETMRENGGFFVVSNGEQTDTVWEARNLEHGLGTWSYEPDDPNFTPRITGVCSVGDVGPRFQFAVLRRSIFGGACHRLVYNYNEISNGLGLCITTYAGDGKPLPAFTDDPLLMPIGDGIDSVLDAYWQALDPENRVSLAVKFIPIAGGKSTIRVINKYAKVQQTK